jgi:hypothetical protein
MTFSELQAGDVFEAHGAIFQKLPRIRVEELPGANAVNTATRRLALFGATVPVKYVKRRRLYIYDGVVCLLVSRNRSTPGWQDFAILNRPR